MSEPHLRSSGARTVGQMQDNMLAYFRLFAGLPGITVADEDVFWLVSARGEPGNHLLWTRIPGDAADRRIDAIIDQIGQYTDQIDWLVFPGCHPADLGTRLEARGMVGGPGGTWMLTELPARPSPFAIPERFRIEQVRTLEMLDVWRQVSAKGGYVQIQTAADCHPAVGAPEAGGDACAALGQC